MSADIVAKFAKRGAPFDGGHFTSLFESPAEASRALWTSLELVHSLLCTHETQQVLVHGAHEVTSARALVLLELLAKEPGPLRNAPTSYTTPVYGYPGWSKSLEQILRALPERTALVDGWTSLESPFGPALGLALARLGEVGAAALDASTLQEFAVSAAKHLKWCPEVFANADVAFGDEQAWQRALAQACASDAVSEVTITATQFERCAPFLTDDQLCDVVDKRGLTDEETRKIAAEAAARGPNMHALVAQRATAVIKGGVERYRTHAFVLVAWVYCLKERNERIPESLMDVTREVLERPFHPTWMWEVVRALPFEERDALLLPWLRTNPDPRRFPTQYSTPAIADWAVTTLLQNDDGWLGPHLPEFGPWTVTHLSKVTNLESRSRTFQYAVVHVAAYHPSPEAAALLVALLQRSSEAAIAAQVAEALVVQPVEVLVAAVKATFAELTTERQGMVAEALMIRAFEPEVRSLAQELRNSPKGDLLSDVLALALDDRCPLPLEVAQFVRQVRALPASLHQAAERNLSDLRARKWMVRNDASDDEGRATLYRLVCAGMDASMWATQLAQRGDMDAALFYMLHAWPRGGDLWRVMKSAGARVRPALAMIFAEPIRWRRVNAQAQTVLLMYFGEVDAAQLIRLVDETDFTPQKDQHEPILTALTQVLNPNSDQAERAQVVTLLRRMLSDKSRRGLALAALGQEAVPELRQELEALKASKLAKADTKLLEQALLLAKAGDALSTQASEQLALVPLAQAGSDPIVRIEPSETIVAAFSAGTLSVYSRDGLRRIHIDKISVDWRVSPDGGYVVSLNEDGVALFDQRGEQISPDEDGGAGAFLYPNDGISGALPIDSTRFLVWAAGHNVYEALTLYDSSTGQQLFSRKAPSQVADVALLPNAKHFVVLSDGGTLELRDGDGKREKSLGRVDDLGHGWTQLKVINGGKSLLVWDEHCAQVLQESSAGKFRKTGTTRSGEGKLVSHPLSSHFVVVTEKRVDVYGASGDLVGVFELPTRPENIALSSDAKLAVSVAKELHVYDLATNRLVYIASCEYPTTALCGGQREVLIGASNGQILRASWSS